MNKLVEIKRESKALIVIPEADILTVFTGDFATHLEPHLAKLRKIVAEFQKANRDPALASDREEIEDFAWDLLKTRTAIEGHRKALADRLKALPKKNDENGRTIRLAIEQMEASVLEPVTAWKAKEAERVNAHVAAIEAIRALGENIAALSVDDLMARVKRIPELSPIGDAREEFEEEYERAQRVALGALGAALVTRRQFEADQIELAALRKLQAERDAKDAAEKAEREAREATERAARERAERDREAAARAEREATEAAQRAKDKIEADAREAAAKAERDRLAAELAEAEAERRRLETEARVRREADEEAAERARIAEDQRKAAEEAEKARSLDIEHRRRFNAEALVVLALLVPGGGAQGNTEVALAILKAIIRGSVPHCTMVY